MNGYEFDTEVRRLTNRYPLKIWRHGNRLEPLTLVNQTGKEGVGWYLETLGIVSKTAQFARLADLINATSRPVPGGLHDLA